MKLSALRTVSLDTNVFIYHIQESPEYLITTAIFDRIEKGVLKGYTTSISLLEVLVKPFKAGDQVLAKKYEDTLTTFPNLEVLSVDSDLAREAAYLRAKYDLIAPDAIVAASALGKDALVTNDETFKVVKEIKVVLLNELKP